MNRKDQISKIRRSDLVPSKAADNYENDLRQIVDQKQAIKDEEVNDELSKLLLERELLKTILISEFL